MDHSVYGYLSRRSTAELITILKNCLQEQDFIFISEIMAILNERGETTLSYEIDEK